MSNNEYGYLPKAPEQSFGNNDGVFSVNDVRELMIADKWTSLGQLDLISTQTASSAFLDFEDLDDYDTYLFTLAKITVSTQTEFGYRLKKGGSYDTSNYQFGNKREQVGGSANRQSTSQATVRLGGDTGTGSNDFLGGYVLLQNARNSGHYTFTTSHVTFINSGAGSSEFGSGMYKNDGVIDGIRFGEGIFSALDSGVISQYGVKAY